MMIACTKGLLNVVQYLIENEKCPFTGLNAVNSVIISQNNIYFSYYTYIQLS